LAYGDRQAGPDITPGSTLVFEVELVSIQPKADTKSEAPADKPADQGDKSKPADQGDKSATPPPPPSEKKN
jgi:hypothetical protein